MSNERVNLILLNIVIGIIVIMVITFVLRLIAIRYNLIKPTKEDTFNIIVLAIILAVITYPFHKLKEKIKTYRK